MVSSQYLTQLVYGGRRRLYRINNSLVAFSAATSAAVASANGLMSGSVVQALHAPTNKSTKTIFEIFISLPPKPIYLNIRQKKQKMQPKV